MIKCLDFFVVVLFIMMFFVNIFLVCMFGEDIVFVNRVNELEDNWY